MFIVGGREGDVGRALPTAMYDTEACEWKAVAGMGRVRFFIYFALCSFTAVPSLILDI